MTPYVGEIRMFAGNFAPLGWEICDGRLIAISDNETLFQLIGTTYGGDGQSTFALPDLRGRIPIHQGSNFILGETAGQEEVTLTVQQIPAHNHVLLGRNEQGNTSNPAGAVPALSTLSAYTTTAGGGNDRMALEVIAPAGGSIPHNNMMPYLCVNFIISLYGIFPSPT